MCVYTVCHIFIFTLLASTRPQSLCVYILILNIVSFSLSLYKNGKKNILKIVQFAFMCIYVHINADGASQNILAKCTKNGNPSVQYMGMRKVAHCLFRLVRVRMFFDAFREKAPRMCAEK